MQNGGYIYTNFMFSVFCKYAGSINTKDNNVMVPFWIFHYDIVNKRDSTLEKQ